TTSSAPSAYCARRTFLSNLPTLVLGTLSIKLHLSGSHHLATRSARNSFSSSALASTPGFNTTQHSGRSSHLSSGTAITAASKTAGCAMTVTSSSTELIHSPPDLITSLERSVTTMYPSPSRVPMSPVHSHPSRNLSGSSTPKYDAVTQALRTSNSPTVLPSRGRTVPSSA